MTVHYKTFARFVEFFGKEGDIDLAENASVLDLLNNLTGSDENKRSLIFDEADNLRRYVIVLKNNERIQNENVANIPLQNGDEVTVYPPVSGG